MKIKEHVDLWVILPFPKVYSEVDTDEHSFVATVQLVNPSSAHVRCAAWCSVEDAAVVWWQRGVQRRVLSDTWCGACAWIGGEDALSAITTWTFYVEGVEVSWNSLPDELRMAVRTREVWGGQVKDYWKGLRYKDDSWYTLEVLEQL